MRNENIHENTNANYVVFFLNCVTFYTMNVFDLRYSHIYTYLFEIIFTEL
jgi:hypothetical protein